MTVYISWQGIWIRFNSHHGQAYFSNLSLRVRGRLHGAFSTPGLNSALFTRLKFQPCL
jgi:hypothetical protein